MLPSESAATDLRVTVDFSLTVMSAPALTVGAFLSTEVSSLVFALEPPPQPDRLKANRHNKIKNLNRLG